MTQRVRRALGTLVVATGAIAVCASAQPSVLVPRSDDAFPGWEAGPLHWIAPRLTSDPRILNLGFSVVAIAMLLAYGVIVRAAGTVPSRTLIGVVVTLHLILFLAPPLQLSDVFNYLGYARLGALHHLDPYAYSINRERRDPVYEFTSWHNLRSPYGPLFTALSYPLGLLPLPVAYWAWKASTIALSLAFLTLVCRCAQRLGRDPRRALSFVALNPVFLICELGGFHNDLVMLVPAMAAIWLTLKRCDRSAGAALVAAVMVKFVAVVLAPFLVLAVTARGRRLRQLAGAAAALAVLGGMSAVLFGPSLPNLGQQSSLLIPTSIPNLVGLVIGTGADRFILDLADLVVVVVVIHQGRRRDGDWLTAAGWSTLALMTGLSWLVPWYLAWLLPLAALSDSRRLQRWTCLATVFLVVTFLPATGMLMTTWHVNLLDTPAGRASQRLQNTLAR